MVGLEHEFVGQLVEVDLIETIPDPQQRDQVFLADLLLDPRPHGILVHQRINVLKAAVEFEPLGLFAERFGVFQVQRRVGVIGLQEPLFQRLRVVLLLQAGPVGIVFVGDLAVLQIGDDVPHADDRPVVQQIFKPPRRMPRQPGHCPPDFIRGGTVHGLQFMAQQFRLLFRRQFMHVFHSCVPLQTACSCLRRASSSRARTFGFQIKWRQTLAAKNHTGFSISHHRRAASGSRL